MNYADEVASRMRQGCPNPSCVLNGTHALHRNKDGNQWIPDGREGVQNICPVRTCVLLDHSRGQHQNRDGEPFVEPPPEINPTHAIRGSQNVAAFRDAVAKVGATPEVDTTPLLQRPPHSEHYAAMSPEPIDVIDAWGLGFNLGCVLKYLARPKGQTIADLEKAVWYLQHELDRRRAGAL